MDLNIQFIQSPSDDNIYKMIRLSNGMDCLLISDPEADKSAASMSIDVGSCDDPDTRPGLAHFLEHMLFMGTKKYPEQNDYSKYLNMNSGSSNAFTADTFTNYHFTCSNDAFEGALDRFAQFFLEPLFDQTCVEKELNAVNSESELNVVDDYWREYLIFKTSAKKGHPFAKFTCGNMKSLQHPNIRDEVLKFYDDHYSSNLMRLCVCGVEDIETLENWVIQHFEAVPNKKYQRRVLKEMPFAKENLSNFWKLVPIKDHDYLDISWIFEGLFEHYRNHPLKYLSRLIGHEGENSLLSLLKEEGLATKLESGEDSELNLFHIFSIRIKLTPYGYDNYKRVIGYIFQYINMLREKGAQNWFFEEISKIWNLQYEFMEKSDPLALASDLSSKLLYYPYEDVLKIDYFMEEYDENLINQTIQGFTLDNMKISLFSKKCEPECNLVEEWYGGKYAVSPLDQDIIDMYHGKNMPVPKKTNKILDLPPKNIFLPENFEVLGKEEDDLPEEPHKIKDEGFSEVWFKQDNKFFLPKAEIDLHLYFKDANFGHSVDASTLSKLWLKLFKYHIQEMGYLAEEASTSYYFYQDHQGYSLHMDGYSDTILIVLKKFFEKLLDFKPQELEERYKDIRHEGLQKYKNFINEDSATIGGYFFEILSCTGNSYSIDKKNESLTRLTFEDVIGFHEQVLQNIKLLWYFTGNLKEEDVLDTVGEIEDTLTNKRQGVKCRPLESHEILDSRIIQIPDGSTWIYEYNHTRENPTDTANTSSVIFQTYQLKTHNHRTRILNDLFEFYIRESFFNQLRTNEQLGYSVNSYTDILRGVQFFTFFIQSDVKSPQYLRERIAAFLEDWKNKFDTLIGSGDEAATLEEDFNKAVESLRIEYLEKLLHLGEESARYWKEIETHKYYWNRRAEYAEQLLTITKEEFREFVLDTFFKDPRKLEVHVVSESIKEENEKHKAENREKVNIIESIDEFKSRMTFYPDFYAVSKV